MIKQGSKVKFDYTLKVDGEVRDTSSGRGPLEYVHGAGHIIKGLESALEGLKPGDAKVVKVAAADGYGELNPESKKTVPADAITNAKDLKVGDIVGAQAGGQTFQAVVSKISDKEIELDFNHPLAGKELVFDVKIVDVAEGDLSSCGSGCGCGDDHEEDVQGCGSKGGCGGGCSGCGH